MTQENELEKDGTTEFMLAVFQAGMSTRAQHNQSSETLLNIHVTIVSVGLAGVVGFWTQSQPGTPPSLVTIVALSLLLVLGLVIEYRVRVHDFSYRRDGYRSRLAQQFFIDKYADTKAAKYIGWTDKPEDRLIVSKGAFGRSPIALVAIVNALVFAGLLFFIAERIDLQLWFSTLLSIIGGFIGWLIQKTDYHREAARQGFKP